jgi:hypothetical protein
MDAAHTIRQALARVSSLRATSHNRPSLQQALLAVKRFQARRFAGTYADFLNSREFGGATRFFLEELYGDRDFSKRDAQFARIAGALPRLFPKQVIGTAVALAELHASTEELDHAMALVWAEQVVLAQPSDEAHLYLQAWRRTLHKDARWNQLQTVLQIGKELDRLTRSPGLRMTLRMMRAPAKAAGLQALQVFLEKGFDTFADMGGRGLQAQHFLDHIREREMEWIGNLFEEAPTLCEQRLRDCTSNTR